MGAAASVHDREAVVEKAGKLADSGSREVAPSTFSMPDVALRQALRQLQLSPDMIDKSASAIYAHARDPIEHPVDKELARLCASEYTRGALNALAAYLLYSCSNGGDSKDDGSTANTLPTASSTTRYNVESKMDHTSASITTAGSRQLDGGTLVPSRGGEGARGGGGGGGGGLLMDSMSGKLSTIFNRLRRTRSMPSRDNGVTSHHGSAADDDGTAVMGRPATGTSAGALASVGGGISEEEKKGTPPRINIRVKQSPRRSSYSMAGLGLISPRSVKTPRRAPVRTGHWKLGHEIGKGSFGAVHIGLNEDSGDLIAVKVLSLRHADTAEPLYREIELMRQLSHPNIVCYLGAEVNDSDKTISIFQEWVPGSVTTLLVNFGPFTDRRVAGYTKQILQGLMYLHNERVIHRDIKGGNILIDDRGVVKLCDFGASKMLDTESFTGMGDHTRVGSPLFMAPEILLRQDYGPQVDIWSLGGAVLEMATGQPPWHTLNLRTPVALLNWVKRTEGPPPLPEGLSQRLTKFLLRCFERDPKKRATAKDLLSDPFVSKRHSEELKHSASDADSVSDIANLSRTAAIARIRRASLSDCSRPSSADTSDCASDSAPGSPRSSQLQPRGTAAAGHAGSTRKGSVSPRSRSPGGEDDRERSYAGGMGASELGSNAPPPRDVRGATPGEGLSVYTGSAASPRGRDIAAVDPTASSRGSPRVTTPPPRRVPTGGFRSGGGSPNPFGGRRRSVEHSPDNARSPRASTGAGGAPPAVQEGAARPRGGTAASNGVTADGGEGGGKEEEKGEGGEGGRERESVAASGSNSPTIVMAREPVHVNATRGSSALKRNDSSSSMGSIISGGNKGREEKKQAGRDGGGPISVVPIPSFENPPLERTPLKKGRSGRGGRPSGAANGSSANSGDAAEPGWRWNQ